MLTTSKKHIAYLADFCATNGVNEIVISPGSRNAPIVIATERHPNIKTHLIHDERCAAFFALGLAEASGKPVALTCTSGSALLNYAPALVEAYYRQIPLLVLSADRPAHLIDQGDGQTIRQENIYSNFIKSSFTFPETPKVDLSDVQEMCVEVIGELYQLPVGPVHLNIPLDEPLYEVGEFRKDEVVMLSSVPNSSIEPDWQEVEQIWKSAEKKLLIVGQHKPDPALEQLVTDLAADPSVAILVENTSNIQSFSKFCHCIDRTLARISEEEKADFAPEVLVSIGGAVISKRIKAYFRQHKAKHNFRVGHFLIEEDTYQSLTHTVKMDEKRFLQKVLSFDTAPLSNFGGKWKQKDLLARDQHDQFLQTDSYSDLHVFHHLLDLIPDHAQLHMGNSSVVRYCQLFDPVRTMNYFSNRGVSGIDGSASTAAGFSVQNKEKLNVLISGDISFFYDSNAYWNKELGSNFKVIVISNGGGGIFQIIPGPSTSEQSETFFAPTTASVEGVCKTYDLNYTRVSSLEELSQSVESFFSIENNDRPSVMEISTQSAENAEVLKRYFEAIASVQG